MKLYPDAMRDQRVREYLPATRVLWSDKVRDVERLVGNREIQSRFAGVCEPATLEAGGSLLLDFGIELHGGIRILNVGAGGRIRLRFGESASEAMGSPDQTHAIHDEELTLPPLGMLEYGSTAFRFVRIDNLGEPLAILNVLAVAIYRDLEWNGAFESSDERLTRIWHTGAYTLLLNMQDYIYDGAKRDRTVWMGDLHPEVRGSLAVFGDSSLVADSLEYLRRTTPLPLFMNNIKTYSLWWIICQRDYFVRTGDRVFLEKQRDYLTGLLELCLEWIDEEGSERIPPRRFLDWPNNDDPVAMHAGLQGLLAWAFECGAELCRHLGCDAARWQEAAARLRRHRPDCGNSKAAAAMLTLGGVADRSLVVQADPYRGVSTFYGFYMLLAQPTRPALELIRRYWGAMLDYGATTFWEDFDLDWLKNTSPISELPVPGKDDLHADFGKYCYRGLRHSFCHGWACGPTPFLSERVLGVTFLEPGGTKVSVSPDLGDLEYVRGRVPTPRGAITVEADVSGKLRVDAPNGIEVV